MKQYIYITPECCEKAKTTYVVRLGLYSENVDGNWKNIKPKWYLTGVEFYYNREFPLKIEVNKCSFCGEILPDLEINKDFNKKIVECDEEYCDTCGERNMSCNCYPPEFRWKIKK